MRSPQVQDVLAWIEDISGRYDREIERSLRRADYRGAEYALAGKDACNRIRDEIRDRTGYFARLAGNSHKTSSLRREPNS